MRIRVNYEPNTDYHPSDWGWLSDSFIFDYDKLKEFAETTDEYAYYAKDEAEMIIKRIDSKTEIYGLEFHDKYTFFDTEWEREYVLSDNQVSDCDREITIYLNT